MIKIHPINYLFIFGILLLSATSIHLPYTSITLGAILLLMFSVVSFTIGIKMTPTLKIFIGLFIAIAICFAIGFEAHYSTFEGISYTAWHDTLAYLLIFVTIVALGCDKLKLSTCIKASSIIIPIFYLSTAFFPHLWYQHQRLAGLAQNPNQFALALLPIPLTIIYFFKTANYKTKLMMEISFIACIFLAYLTKTHALILAWLLTLALYIIYVSSKYVLQRITRQWLITITVITIIFFTLFTISLANHFNLALHLFMLTNAEPQLRLHLWSEAIALIQKSVAFGFGPGSFLKYSSSIYPNQYEAHNIFIDLLLQGGIVSVSLFLVFLTVILKQSLKIRLGFFIMLNLIVFSLFHYTFRQPMLWIYFYWILETALSRRYRKPDFNAEPINQAHRYEKYIPQKTQVLI